LLLLISPTLSVAQSSDSISHINKKRLRGFVITSSVAYTVSLAALSQLWYSNSPSQPFQFFNDNAEWKQVDKVGHTYSAYQLSATTAQALRWCGVSPRKSDIIGAISGFAMLVPIEILDGKSQAYGASPGDLIADAVGAGVYLGQSLLWKEQRIISKFSFHRTSYPPLNPDLLGNGMPSEIIKDYNGQTYWLSVDMDKFMKFPRWLNLAAGYGAEGMVYARDQQNIEAGYEPPYRQYYISLDFDLTCIKTRSKAVKALIFFANMIKIPAPTLEFSSKGVRFHALYF
jgi:uncharacterized protein YfiM (DUF2279 family)